MKNYKEVTTERIKKVLYADKLASPSMFKQTLRVEIFSMLKDFIETKLEDINVSVLLNKDGKYKINISVETDYIKPIGQIID